MPEIPAASPGAVTRRASPWRLGLLTTALTFLVGGLAWYSDTPELSRSEPAQVAVISPNVSGRDDLVLPQAREGMEQELRLAAMALQIRESQDNLARLWDEARLLASSIGSLASGIEGLKSDVGIIRQDVGAVRDDAIAGLTQVDARLQHVEVATVSELVPLGDPALRETTTRLGYAEFATREPPIVQASAPVQPATTGGLAEVRAPQASVKVSFSKPKPRVRAPKPIGGWLVHNVRDDLALVESQGAHYEVRAGELLPDAGIVRSIKKRGDRWVVLTSRGVITEAK